MNDKKNQVDVDKIMPTRIELFNVVGVGIFLIVLSHYIGKYPNFITIIGIILCGIWVEKIALRRKLKKVIKK